MLASFLFSLVKPIYGFENKKRNSLGSCALLEVDGRAFLITAAHVLEQRASIPLFVQDMPLAGGWWSGMQNGCDFAVYPMSRDEVESLAGALFLMDAAIDRLPLQDGCRCQLMGYPASKNKNFSNASASITPEIHLINTHVVPRGSDDNGHIFWVQYGEKIFSPKGMSGGLVARFEVAPVPITKAIGMPIEYDKRTKTIKCIKYSFIANSIRAKGL